MADKIVGMMFAKDEADVLPFTIADALKHVHSLFIADDGSVDGSWEIIKYFRQQYPDKVEHVQQNPVRGDQGQRSQLFAEICKRYKPENTWVQTIEADIMLGTQDLPALIEEYKREDVSVDWQCMNAVRPYWEEVHKFYPNWPEDIKKIMTYWHHLEVFSTYTYRPLPNLYFSARWRPWPNGFSKYHTPGWARVPKPGPRQQPLALHYGYRGPSHLLFKRRLYSKPLIGDNGWDYTSIETITNTCPFFSGVYNRHKQTRPDVLEAWYNRD